MNLGACDPNEWLNASYGAGDKSWLNSSLNLPPEQRYNSLNEMVTKIIDDELMASGNSSTLSLSFRSGGTARNDKRNRMEELHPTNNFQSQQQQQQPAQNVAFIQQLSQLESQQQNGKVYSPSDAYSYLRQQIRQPHPFYPAPIIQMPVFSTAVAHHFATLTPDQQTYLIQQQQQLLHTLALSENQQQPTTVYSTPMDPSFFYQANHHQFYPSNRFLVDNQQQLFSNQFVNNRQQIKQPFRVVKYRMI